MAIVPVSEFAPDMPVLPGASSDGVFNCLPRTPLSYGPWLSLTPISSALTARCQGTATMQDTSGNVRVFAGDATKLYRLSSGTTFADVSKVGGYSTGATERWSFGLFGNRVIATNYTNNIQSYVEGTSSAFADMIASGITTLKARYCATVKNFFVVGNTVDGTFGTNPQRVWWSAIEDPTNFPTPGTSGAAAVQSDYQDVVGPHGWLMGIAGNLGNADAALFFERAVYRMIYVGPPAIFDIRAAEGIVGCPAPGSIIQFRSTVFYLGEDGFYQFDGATSRPIGKHKVDRWFFDNVDQSKIGRVNASVDPVQPIIYWAFPTQGASDCNRILAYNWAVDRWSATDADAVTVQVLFRSLTLGYDADSVDGIFANADAANVLNDSREFTGGRLVMSAFNSSNRLCYFNGPALAATVETQKAQIFDGKQAMVNKVRPIVDGGSPVVAVSVRETPTGTETYGADTSIEARTGEAPVRARGRYMNARIKTTAGSTWSHISGIDITDVVPLGTN